MSFGAARPCATQRPAASQLGPKRNRVDIHMSTGERGRGTVRDARYFDAVEAEQPVLKPHLANDGRIAADDVVVSGHDDLPTLGDKRRDPMTNCS